MRIGEDGDHPRRLSPRRTAMILLARASGYSTPRDPSRVASRVDLSVTRVSGLGVLLPASIAL
ncbi:hypothetical protein F2Q69_00023521 [Brassica cretica]|uniref:Uncharacterized protein n=1 Tax=Brassica cretica TaxID=69181 RepID=A0A8S9Q2M2_BRACR|nr:hypothetical protein F2Q69_00023521 [Brassica cretica]